MSVDDTTRVGLLYAADGSKLPVRSTKEGAIVFADVGPRYSESAGRDQIFTACTAVAGVAPGTALSTTPPLVLHNPVGSGKNLEIIRSSCGYVSGTLGAGTLVYAGPSTAQPNAPTGGTALVVACGRLGGSDNLSVALATQGATLAAVPRILRPAFTLGAALATTPAFATPATDQLNGEYVVAPGNFIALQGIAAAGLTPLVLLSIAWREAQAS